MTDCALCQKLNNLFFLSHDELVWQFPHSVAFLGPWQYYTGYCVLVARAHVREIHHLPLEVRQAHVAELCQMAQAIETCFAPRKLNIESLGNQVPHLHWHLFPRREDDPDNLKAVWLALEGAARDPATQERMQSGLLPRWRIAAQLRECLVKQGN